MSPMLDHTRLSRFCWMSGQMACIFTYDKMSSLLAPYGNAEALAVARDLDSKIERLLRESAL